MEESRTVLSHSSALPSAILLAQSSLCPWAACNHITHTLICIRTCAHTSLPDASPLSKESQATTHPQLAAAQVTSQASTSPFQILSLLPLPERGPTSSDQLLASCSQDCSGKGCDQDPPSTSHGSASGITCVLVPPLPLEAGLCPL